MTKYSPNKEDVKRVAEAMLEQAVERDVTIGMNAYNICRHCDAQQYWDKCPDDLVHKPDCLVLVARDLLVDRKEKVEA